MGILQSQTSPKEVLTDKYLLGRVLGVGGFGEVRECIHRETRELRAVKVVARRRKGTLGKKATETLFKSECDIMNELEHPNIIKHFQYYEDREKMYGVLEKCEGGALFKHIKEQNTFSEEDAARLCNQMLLALEYIHNKGIAHRDIKGENFLLKDESNTLKLIDFGIACKTPEAGYLTEMCGTLHYLAPEMFDRKYGKEIDIWAIGVLMYLMVYGRYPFPATTQKDIKAQIMSHKIDWSLQEVQLSPDIVDFLSKLLERNPETRLTAKQALQHKFLRRAHSRKQIILPKKILEDAFRNEQQDIKLK